MNWHVEVHHVMTKKPIYIDVDSEPSEVLALLEAHSFHHLPVLDGGALVGIVSSVDLARVSLGAWVEDNKTQRAWLDQKFRVRDLMTAEPDTIGVGDPLRLAADKLSTGNYHSLPVLDENEQLVGMLTSTDLLRYMATTD